MYGYFGYNIVDDISNQKLASHDMYQNLYF